MAPSHGSQTTTHHRRPMAVKLHVCIYTLQNTSRAIYFTIFGSQPPLPPSRVTSFSATPSGGSEPRKPSRRSSGPISATRMQRVQGPSISFSWRKEVTAIVRAFQLLTIIVDPDSVLLILGRHVCAGAPRPSDDGIFRRGTLLFSSGPRHIFASA